MNYYEVNKFSASAAKVLMSGLSPYSAFYKLRNPFSPTAAMTLGTITHSAIENHGSCADDIAVVSPFDSFRTKEAKEWKAQQSAIITTKDELAKAHKMAKNVMDAIDTRAGKHEVEIYTEDSKARIDFVGDNGIVWDWKTSAITKGKDLFRECWKWGLDIQAAQYLKLTGLERFNFGFVSTAEPHEVFIIECGESFLATGKEKLDQAFELWMLYKDTPLEEIPKAEPATIEDNFRVESAEEAFEEFEI